MIEINLLSPEYRPKTAPKFTAPQLPVKKTFILVAVFVFGVQLLASIFAVYQSVSLTIVKAQAAQLAISSSSLTKKKAEISAAQERMGKIRRLTERKFYWSAILNALTHSTTKGVWLTGAAVVDMDAALQNGKSPGKKNSASKSPATGVKILKLDGSVVGQGEETAFTGKFIKELKANTAFNDLFSGIELSNLVQKKIRDFDVYDFSIYCTFKADKAAAQ